MSKPVKITKMNEVKVTHYPDDLSVFVTWLRTNKELKEVVNDILASLKYGKFEYMKRGDTHCIIRSNDCRLITVMTIEFYLYEK